MGEGAPLYISTQPAVIANSPQNQEGESDSIGDLSQLANSSILQCVEQDDHSTTRSSSSEPRSPALFNNSAEASHLETPQTDSFLGERHGLKIPANFNDIASNLSQGAAQCMQGALADSTKSRYNHRLILWEQWCKNNNIVDSTKAGIANILNYLAEVHKKGVSYSVVNISKCAISSVHEFVDGEKIGSHNLVHRFMQGVFKAAPPKPKYVATWDITSVLQVLAGTDFNPDSEIRIRQLKRKTVMLIILSTACRQSVIPRLQRTEDFILDRGDHFVLHPDGWDKNSRFSKSVHDLLIFKNKVNPLISPYDSLKEYISRSRVPGGELFVSDTKGKPLQTKEVSDWISFFMNQAQIPDCFTPHSTRSASTSKAEKILGSAAIMEAVDWKQEKTFRKFYLRNVQKTSTVEARRSFQEAVLG